MPYVIGVDPGPTVGIVGLMLLPNDKGVPAVSLTDVVQCSAGCVDAVLNGLSRGVRAESVLSVERFVIGPRAARVNASLASAITRAQLTAALAWADSYGIRSVQWSAAAVKPWATDTRLAAAGLLEPTKGMRHARDAARHALYTAVKDCGLPDPLSKRGVVRA